MTANFSDNKSEVYRLNIAILGVGLSTEILRGENRNKTLDQDFVTLWHVENLTQWSFELPDPRTLAKAERYAVALWVTHEDNSKPLQAAGSWWSL